MMEVNRHARLKYIVVEWCYSRLTGLVSPPECRPTPTTKSIAAKTCQQNITLVHSIMRCNILPHSFWYRLCPSDSRDRWKLLLMLLASVMHIMLPAKSGRVALWIPEKRPTNLAYSQHTWHQRRRGFKSRKDNYQLNYSLSEYFVPKIQNLGLKIPHFGKIYARAKLNYWACIVSLVGNFLQLSGRKVQFLAS